MTLPDTVRTGMADASERESGLWLYLEDPSVSVDTNYQCADIAVQAVDGAGGLSRIVGNKR